MKQAGKCELRNQGESMFISLFPLQVYTEIGKSKNFLCKRLEVSGNLAGFDGQYEVIGHRSWVMDHDQSFTAVIPLLIFGVGRMTHDP